MEIYFNELSILPIGTTKNEAKQKLLSLLETMKALKEYDFNVIRTHDTFYAENFGDEYTPASFLNDDDIKRDLRQLMQTIVKNPFIGEEDDIVEEMFVVNQFQTLNHSGVPTSPEGLAISYICEMPTISISGFPLWNSNTLALNVKDTDTNVNTTAHIINVSSANSTNDPIFSAWIKSITINVQLNSYENIISMFPVANYDIETRAIKELISWFYNDRRYIVRIVNLIKDIRNAPFVGGMGLTENLGGGRGSKRIVKKDRVVYTVLHDKIIIHSCKKHYDDN